MSKPIIWQPTKSETLFEGRRTIENRYYITPDGVERAYELTLTPDAVGVIPITESGMVVLTRQFRPGVGSETLEFPGGQIDEGEDPKVAALREMVEETGYSGDLTYLGRFWTCAYTSNYKYMYLARNCKKVQEQKLDEGEFVEVELMPIEDLCQLKFTGSSSDMLLAFKALEELGFLTVHCNILRGK